MASLYEIDEQLRILEEYMVDAETGEILSEEEFYAKFDEIQMALSEKIENTMCFYKNLMSDVEAFKVEEKRLTERRKVKEKLAERLKNRIDSYIVAQYTDVETGEVDTANLNKWKMETPKVKLGYRKSESVEADVSLLPKEYLKVKTEVSADKTELKKALKDGKKIQGAELVTKYNMQVK